MSRIPNPANLTLAKRLESHEAWSSGTHARRQAELYPATGAAALLAGDGLAVFCGKESPLNWVYGWGMAQPATTADLNSIKAFYLARGVQARLRVCPLADPTVHQLLVGNQFRPLDQMCVHYRAVEPAMAPSPTPSGLTIRVATVEEARLWFERDGAGGDWAEPDGISFMTVRCVLKEDTRLFLAWMDDQPVGGGGLETHAGVAGLMAAATLPEYRNRGIHGALMQARLAAAAASGCDLAMVHTSPGAASQRNVQRAGFQLAYTVTRLVTAAPQAEENR
jgi:GNAT superfamily N-acetyltransferase